MGVKGCWKQDFSMVKRDWHREHLRRPDFHKWMGPVGTHSRVLRELVDTTASPLIIIFEWSWGSREVSEDWTKVNVTPVYKKGKKEDPRNCWPARFTSVPPNG